MTTQTLSLGPDAKIVIERVGGDLMIEGWDRSDIEMRGDEVQYMEPDGGAVSISSAGDLNLSMPRGAALTLIFVGGDLKLDRLDSAIKISFVGGDAFLGNLTGDVSIEGIIGGDIKMENVSAIRMNASRGDAGGNLSAQIRRKVESATRRAEKKIQDAGKKIRRAEFISIERKTHRGIAPIPSIPPVPPIPPREPKARRWNFGFDPSGASEAQQPVSDEERLTILKMLQEKKITSEEADKLLAALEGG